MTSGDAYIALKNFLGFLLYPSNIVLILILISTGFLVLRWRRIALAGNFSALAILVLLAYFPGGELLIAPLEARFPPVRPETAPKPFGIIILGGSVIADQAAQMGTLMEFDEGGERVPVAAILAQRFPDARLIVTGGNASDIPGLTSEADAMRDMLAAFGVDPGRVAVEREALSTLEQVLGTMRIIGEDRDRTWWVITSAYHMPRAIGTFRKAGLRPIAFPVDFRRIPPFDPLYVFNKVSDGLKMTDVAVREWVGLFIYWLTGSTDELFPSP